MPNGHILGFVASQSSVQQARRLVDQILRDARAHDHRALLAIEAEPDTVVLLDLLPDTATNQARKHLQGARVWRGQQAEKAKGKLDTAKTALDGLDISLARGLLRKIDSSFLEDSDFALYDELLLAAEARAVELEDIQKRVSSSSPARKKKRRGRFRKR